MLRILNPFVGRFRVLKGTLETIAAIGGCLGFLELVEITNIVPEKNQSGSTSTAGTPSTYNYVNAGNLFLNTAISDRVTYTSYDWLNLKTDTPGVTWSENVDLDDARNSKACIFRLSGSTTFSISGNPDLMTDGITPATWDVVGCGVRTMVFHVSAVRPPSLDDVTTIANSLLEDLQNQGFSLEPLGCILAGGYYDYIELYQLNHPAKRHSILEVYLSRPGGGTSNQITVTNHIVGSIEKVLQRGLFGGRASLTTAGCEELL